jgi:AraC-like DNA-binding protein
MMIEAYSPGPPLGRFVDHILFFEGLRPDHSVDRLRLSEGDACIEFAVRRISLEPFPGSLQALSEMVGYSRKHFIELFKSRVGVSPKRFLRIFRFRRSLARLQGGGKPDWSRLAMETGYYDQAHLIRDFREFSGFTPSDYMGRLAGDINYLPVG